MATGVQESARNERWIDQESAEFQSFVIMICIFASHFSIRSAPLTPPHAHTQSSRAQSWKELPYDYNPPNWSPAFFPPGELSSGLSAWLLLIFHPIPWAHSTLTGCVPSKNTRDRETMTVNVAPHFRRKPPPFNWLWGAASKSPNLLGNEEAL